MPLHFEFEAALHSKTSAGMKLFHPERSTLFDPTVDTDIVNSWWEEQSKYKLKEPGVIDSTLLTQLVFDQGPKDYGLILAKEEGIDFRDVLRLRISFKNILKIANLWNFSNLVKLQLDNNSISKIEGISHMTNLEWLDLSFNVITKIENLENLGKLKDLTLFHNQIEVLENMEDLKSLEIFSIGKNNLQDIDNVMYLRNFKSLKSINLVDNPMTATEDYRLLMLVYVPQLQYIDYSLVNEDQREKAKIKFENEVLKLEAKDEIMQTERDKKDKDDRRMSYFKKSFLEDFADENLLGTLLHEDDEDSKLKLWWIIEKLFADEISNMSKELFEFGLQQHEAREEELSCFNASLKSLIDTSTSFNIMKIDKFLEYKRKRWAELDTFDLEGFNETKSEYNTCLDELFNCLVREELHLVEDINDIINQLELNLAEMVMSFKTHIHTKISSIRERANQFYDDLLQEANNLAEKKRRPDEFDDIPGEIMHLAGDKMLLTVTIQSCHDQRLAKIDYIQDHIYHRLRNYVPNIIDELHERMEVKRNRERIQEVCHFVEFHRTDGEHVFELIGNLMA